MNKQYLALLVAAVSIAGVLFSAQETKVDAFDQWKGQFAPNWAPEQELYRRTIFEQNLAKIEAHNADPTQTYTMGVNQFTVLTQEEFEHIYLNAIPPAMLSMVPPMDNEEMPNAEIDWSAKGKVTPVKNQGQCGSCWAFSATGVAESQALLESDKTVDLSEQQLVDCTRDMGNYGCSGGWPYNALKYMKDGIAYEADYPYHARNQNCAMNHGPFKISDYTSVTGCAALVNALTSRPISITADAGRWSSYRGGIFNTCGTQINHAILMVGVTDSYWKVKNSWGTGWGENGYIRLALGNTCGVCQLASPYVNSIVSY